MRLTSNTCICLKARIVMTKLSGVTLRHPCIINGNNSNKATYSH